MPRTNRGARALVAAEAMAALASLAGKGAYATATGSPVGSAIGDAKACAVYSPDNDFARPIGFASRPAVARCLSKGWLDWDKPGQCLRISASGLRALRIARKDGAPATPAPTRPAERHGDTAKRTPAEGALTWLRRRKDKHGRPLISEAQFKAGEMLASDFWHAQLLPRVTANWSAVTPSQRMRRPTPGVGVDMRDSVVAARQRFHRAMDAVGPELADILVAVCCHDRGLEAAGHGAGWPQGAARAVLDLALTRLARHYGLIAPERPAASRLRHWGDADYRPTVDAWR